MLNKHDPLQLYIYLRIVFLIPFILISFNIARINVQMGHRLHTYVLGVYINKITKLKPPLFQKSGVKYFVTVDI